MPRFADVDASVPEIVEQIGEADEGLKHHRGFGLFTSGSQLRRLYAAALVLQTYEGGEESVATGQASALASIVVQQIIMMIVMTIIVISISSSNN